ncbi:MAG TPA: nickel-binding protein [Gemmatimonadota bacterium]
MALYLDVHRGVKASIDELAKAHVSDLEAQERYGVKYLKYWFNQDAGTVFCLVEGPNRDACNAVHREAHGLVAEKLIDVESQLLEGFLGGSGESPFGAALWPDGTLDGGLRTIVFTDLVESTALTQKLGDHGLIRLLRRHDEIIRDSVTAFGGREVKHTGDGLMASFVSASKAVESAATIQRRFADHNAENSDQPIRVRIGMSAGEPVSEKQDLFGAAVQMARRVCDVGGEGSIVTSSVVRDLCVGKPWEFVPRGEVPLKGFAQPVPLFDVQWTARG